MKRQLRRLHLRLGIGRNKSETLAKLVGVSVQVPQHFDVQSLSLKTSSLVIKLLSWTEENSVDLDSAGGISYRRYNSEDEGYSFRDIHKFLQLYLSQPLVSTCQVLRTIVTGKIETESSRSSSHGQYITALLPSVHQSHYYQVRSSSLRSTA